MPGIVFVAFAGRDNAFGALCGHDQRRSAHPAGEIADLGITMQGEQRQGNLMVAIGWREAGDNAAEFGRHSGHRRTGKVGVHGVHRGRACNIVCPTPGVHISLPCRIRQ